jgi:mannose-1-phosphate guanylyltransferase/mannose-6-phosphate isomerase
MSLCPVVLAGGSGSRLWPFSRQHYPKQFLNMFGSHTMLQQTLMRLNDFEKDIEIIPSQIICNEAHRFMVVEQAKEIEHALQAVMLEPDGRDTAPALTVAAIWQLQSGIDPVLLMMPADHLIKDARSLQETIRLGYEQARNGVIVTFGIHPHAPETGYGYIECGTSKDSKGGDAVRIVKSFTEKPEELVAKQYLEAGNYLWNSGLFMMQASLWVDIIKHINPSIYECCKRSIELGKKDDAFFRLDNDSFGACPSDSIDYAVMENIGGESAMDAVVITLDAGWSDIGSWSSLWLESDKDVDGNVIDGDVLQKNTKNCLIKARNKLVTVVGGEDLIVVETADAVMVANKNNSQDVKELVDELKATSRQEYETHSQVFRPWGSYETLEMGEGFQVKRIIVNPGKRLSLQLHHKRSEHWVVVQGLGAVTLANKEFDLHENESTFIPIETLHRLENKTKSPLIIIEVQVGNYLGEDDIVRFDDDFGRA